jgi:hypothetical protein
VPIHSPGHPYKHARTRARGRTDTHTHTHTHTQTNKNPKGPPHPHSPLCLLFSACSLAPLKFNGDASSRKGKGWLSYRRLNNQVAWKRSVRTSHSFTGLSREIRRQPSRNSFVALPDTLRVENAEVPAHACQLGKLTERNKPQNAPLQVIVQRQKWKCCLHIPTPQVSVYNSQYT